MVEAVVTTVVVVTIVNKVGVANQPVRWMTTYLLVKWGMPT
jgi:hypothetical protein